MRRFNLFYRVALALGIAAVAVLVVIVLSHVFDMEILTATDKLLNEIATALGIATGLATLLGKRRSSTHHAAGGEHRMSQSPIWIPVTPADVLPVRQSLVNFITQYRHSLSDMSAGDHPFVPLSASTTVHHRVRQEMRPKLTYERREASSVYVQSQQESVDLFQIQQMFPRAVLLGEPGCGKSTCLREIALRQLTAVERQLTEATDDNLLPCRLPLLISMSDWHDRSMPAEEFLRTRLAVLVGNANYFVQNFDMIVRSGGFLFLLDGLNELPGRHASGSEGGHAKSAGANGEARELLPHPGPAMDNRERSLREFAANAAAQCPFTLSCRSHEYFDSMKWVPVHVLPMDDEQIKQFIGAYLPIEEAAMLVSRMAEEPNLRALAANPFFLVSIVTVYRPGIDLTSRGQVLQHLLRTLLAREAARGAESEVEEEELTTHVGRVAYRMLRRGEIGNQVAIDTRGQSLGRELHALVDTGLVVDRQGDLFFCHQIVQEFFAACAMRRRRTPGLLKRLLADKRYSEAVLVWRDLDPERMQRRLTRALRARNLPWRRPGSPGSGPLTAFQFISGVVIVVAALWYVLDQVTWQSEVMSLGVLPVPLGVFLLALVVVRLSWKVLVYHQKVIVNAAYVLGQVGRPAVVIDLVKSFRRVFVLPRLEIAQSVSALGPAATPHVVDGLRSNNWRQRWGCVQALGEILRRRPDDRLASRSIVLLAQAEDPKLVRPLTEALSWCRDPGVPNAIAAMLELAGRTPWLAGHRLEPLNRVVVSVESNQLDERLARQFTATMNDVLRFPIIRGVAAVVIGTLRPAGWEDDLFAVASNQLEQQLVRNYAVQGLGVAQTTEGLKKLVQLGEGRFGEPWQEVQTVLRTVTQSAALPGLATAATSAQWWIREAAATSIGRIGSDEAMEMLSRLAVDHESEVRAATVGGLLLAGRSDGVAVLCRLARDADHRVRSRAVSVLSTNYPDVALNPLVDAVMTPGHPARPEIIVALARFDRPDVDQAFYRLEADPDRTVREATARARAMRERSDNAASGSTWLRHPLSSTIQRAMIWLQWDGLRRMWEEERLAGTASNLIFTKVQARITLDAELTRQYRNVVRVFLAVYYASVLVLAVVALLVVRTCLALSHLLLDHWWATLAALLVGAVTWLPGVRRIEDVPGGWGVAWVLRLVAGSILVVAVIGVLTFTWWVWLTLLILGAIALAIRLVRRGRRAGEHVRALVEHLEMDAPREAVMAEFASDLEDGAQVRDSTDDQA